MSSETNWFYDLTTDDAKEARQHIRVWVGRVLVLLCLLGTTVYYTEAYAEPFAQATAGGVIVTLHTEDCTLIDQISNLPKRATWREKDKVFEGCFAVNPEVGVVMMYFTDKTVAAAPIQMFQKVTGV